ncbi:uncharacterized protein Dvar_49740 [Desulfosarcina variabilis str. Montpellier]
MSMTKPDRTTNEQRITILKRIDYLACLCNKNSLPCPIPPHEGRMTDLSNRRLGKLSILHERAHD